MNYSLPLSPFPSQNPTATDLPEGLSTVEFVDEETVVRLVSNRTGPAHVPLRPRAVRSPREVTVLSGEVADYAGWNRPVLTELPVHPSFLVPTGVVIEEQQPERRDTKRSSEPVAARVAASPFIAVRAQPPVTDPGLGEPTLSGFRWWVGAAGGAVCTLVVSALLYSLSAPPPRVVAATSAAPQPVFLTPVKFERPLSFRFAQSAPKAGLKTPPDMPRPFSGTPAAFSAPRRSGEGAPTSVEASHGRSPSTAAAESF